MDDRAETHRLVGDGGIDCGQPNRLMMHHFKEALLANWIPVLVRAEDYLEIAELVASRESERAGDDLTPATPQIPDQDLSIETTHRPHEDRLARRASWSVEDLARLAEGHTLTTQRWTRAMDVCTKARAEDEIWVPTSEVASRSGMRVNEWRDAPRKISRHLKAHFPNVPKDHNGDAFWPLCPGGDDIPASGGEVWWAITEDMAQRWRQVRGEALG